MNNLVYVGVAIVVIIILVAVFAGFSGTGSHSSTSVATTIAQSNYSTSASSSLNTTTIAYPTTTVSNATTAPTQGNTTLIYNSTPTGKSCTNLSGYQCASVACAVSNSSFTCTNATYGYSPSKNVSEMSLSVGQNTGTDWSSFGIAYVPSNASMIEGQPVTTYYVADNSSSNVGTSLQNGQSTFVQIPSQAFAKGASTLKGGAIWVCYVNSGTLYVANSCTTSGGLPAQYVKIATVSAT